MRFRLVLPLLLGAALARAQPPAGPVVQLPPLLVETDGGPRWRYGEVPGAQVLACCDPDTAADFVEANSRQQDMLDELLAPDLQMRTSAPVELILYDQRYQAALAREVVDEMNRMAPRTGSKAADNSASLLPHLRLTDPDSTEIYLILDDAQSVLNGREGSWGGRGGTRNGVGASWSSSGGGYDELEFAVDYVATLLDGRTPQLPPWFRAGMLRLYQDVRFAGSEVQIEPFTGLDAADRDYIAHTLAFGTELLPPAELFSPAVLPDESALLPVRARVWASESALFIRWAFEGRGHPRREALWQFVREASAAPATEEMFRRCFGLGYAELSEQLEKYLPETDRELSWTASDPPRRPRLVLREAAPAQVRRLKGDWSRRVLDIIRRQHPELVASYLARAQRTLSDAYALGDRSPELLASIGQLDFQTGDTFQARAYLESAVQMGVGRPMPYVELAQLRLVAAVGRNGQHLGRSDIGPVLAPLTAARRLAPELAATYLLMAAMWQHASSPPPPADLALLNAGARLFHRDPTLVLAVASLDLAAHDNAAAESLTALALGSAPSAASRQTLLAFQASHFAVPAEGRR